MLFFLLYILIGSIIGRFAWSFSVARKGQWEMDGSQPIYCMLGVFWPLALLFAVVYALCRPAFKITDKLAKKLADTTSPSK